MAQRLEPIGEEDLTCRLCGELYNQPMLCECGHTFCKACIEHHCEVIESSCPVCRYFVLPLTANIIAKMDVEHWARPLPRNPVNHNFDFLSTPQTPRRMERGGARRSLQEHHQPSSSNFSVPRNIAPRLSARHRRELEAMAHSTTSGSEEYETAFQAGIPRRRSEKTRRRPSEPFNYPASPVTHPFARLSKFRETVAGGRATPRFSFPTTSSDNDYPEVLVLSSQAKNDKQLMTRVKSLWKRMGLFKSKKIAPAVYVLPYAPFEVRSLGRYRGIGANFTRLNKGNEILVGVFGSQSSGKTTFVNNFMLHTSGLDGHTVLSNTERMGWDEPLASNNPPIALLTSTTYMAEDGRRVVDLVEAECDSRSVNGVMSEATSNAFINAVDAAVLVFFASDERSFAKVLSYYRRLARRQVPCIVVANHNPNVETKVSDQMVRNAFARMGVTRCATNLFDINGDTLEIVQHIADRVTPPELPPFVIGSMRRWGQGGPV